MSFDRRTFIGTGLSAFGGAMLPSWTFAGEKNGLKAAPLKFTKIAIKVGATKPFKALHVSDTHLAAANPDELDTEDLRAYVARRNKGFLGSYETYRATVDYAARKKMLLLHTGDLIDFVSARNLESAKAGFGGKGEVFLCRGNHEYWNPADPKGAQRAKAVERVASAYPNDLVCASKIVNGVNFVAIDGADEQIGRKTLERMKAEFAKGLPVVLLLHAPFYTEKLFEASWERHNAKGVGTASLTGVPDEIVDAKYSKRWQKSSKQWSGTKEGISFLKASKQLKAVLCGHLHFEFVDRFSDTAVQYVAGGNFRGEGFEISFT